MASVALEFPAEPVLWTNSASPRHNPSHNAKIHFRPARFRAMKSHGDARLYMVDLSGSAFPIVVLVTSSLRGLEQAQPGTPCTGS